MNHLKALEKKTSKLKIKVKTKSPKFRKLIKIRKIKIKNNLLKQKPTKKNKNSHSRKIGKINGTKIILG